MLRAGKVTASRAFATALVTIAAVVVSACSKTVPENTRPASSAAVSSATIASWVAPLADAGAGSVPALPDPAQASIPGRFATEAARRPAGVPRVEDCLDAFKKLGAEIREEAQHLASPFLAQYCVGFQTGKDVHGSLCEYKDQAIAIKGRETSEKAFASVANRKVYRNGGSTLTLRVGTTTPENDALVKKMIAAFQAVKPASTAPPAGKAPSPFAKASAMPALPDPPPP
jgi:hypothetical protein